MSPRASKLLHDEFCVTGMFDEPEFQRKEQALSTSAKEVQTEKHNGKNLGCLLCLYGVFPSRYVCGSWATERMVP